MKNLLLATGLLALSLGATAPAVAQTTPLFKFWSLKAGAQDSAALRSPSTTTASSATLRRFVLSSGTAAAPPKAYSSLYGMAFAPAADGGSWSTTANGPGGVLRRYFYVQFTATAPAGTTLRADSLAMNLTYLSTTSNTFMAVVYSKTGFTSADSTEATGGGRGPAGALSGVVNGTFNSGYAVAPSIALPTAGAAPAANTPRYSVALNGASGVTIAAGQTLTVRLYLSCSSSSVGRFALLRNVALKSTQTALATRSAIDTNLAAYPNPTQSRLNVPHAAASRDARISVFSATGARVATLAAQPGTTETPVDLSALARGFYLVEYTDGSTRSSARIAKE
jgi:hypothetical protein